MPLVQRCAEGKKANPFQLSGREAGSTIMGWMENQGLNGKSGVECTVLENTLKKTANMLNSSNKPKAVLWYRTNYICACNLCYIPQPQHFLFLFHGNRLTATRNILPTEIKRNLLAQGILASDWTYTCWHVKTLNQKLQNFLISPEGKSLTSY